MIAQIFIPALGGAALATSAMAEDLHRATQAAAVEVEDEARALSVSAEPGDTPRDRHLALTTRIAFEPFDPTRGSLHSVTLDMKVYVEQGFAGLIGDGIPLDETPEPVAIESALATRLDVVGPNGAFLHSEMIETAAAGCASSGTCVFAHHERTPVTLSFRPSPAMFMSGEPVTVILRGTSPAGVLKQLCAPAESWSRCKVTQARIGLTAPKQGIQLHYAYMPAPGQGRTASGVSIFGIGVEMIVAALAVAGAAVGAAVFAWRRERNPAR